MADFLRRRAHQRLSFDYCVLTKLEISQEIKILKSNILLLTYKNKFENRYRSSNLLHRLTVWVILLAPTLNQLS